MFSRSSVHRQREALSPLAEMMADAFSDVGDVAAASQVLELASRHGISDGVALRSAEQAFFAGDAIDAMYNSL